MEKKAGQSSTDMFREMFDKSMNYTNLGMVEITFSPYVQCGSVDRSQNHVVHGSNTPALSGVQVQSTSRRTVQYTSFCL